VLALNYYLFNEMRFSGNLVDYYDPRNSYLNEVMERRTGFHHLVHSLSGSRQTPRAQPERRFFPGHFLVKLAVKRGQLVLDPSRAGGAIRGRSASAPGASSALRKSGAGAARPVSGAGDPAPDHRAGPAQSEEHLYAEGKLEQALAVMHRMLLVMPESVEELRIGGWCTSSSNASAGAVRPAELSAAAAAGAGRSGNPRKDPGAQAGGHAPQLAGQPPFDFFQ